MIDKKIISVVPECTRFVFLTVLLQLIELCVNILTVFFISILLKDIFYGELLLRRMLVTLLAVLASVFVRSVCVKLSARTSFNASRQVKKRLRVLLLNKLLQLGPSYTSKVSSAEVVQVCVEGVDQLETYFGQYLPQFFYSMIAPFILFGVFCFINVRCAAVLLCCVPLIPLVIIFVQKIAKRLLSKYWGQYTSLGSSFLENLQGLTTLKIYQADGAKALEMEKESELFRKITMKVLTMQLNSIVVMDVVAYGGAALGIIVAALELKNGRMDIFGSVMTALLSAEFFIPMRRLGSFFHVAMNGIAASKKIFKILELEESDTSGFDGGCDGNYTSAGVCECPAGVESDVDSCVEPGTIDQDEKIIKNEDGIFVKNLSFAYGKKTVLEHVSMSFPKGKLTAITGESGSGKSTVAKLISKKCVDVCYTGAASYIFAGTVRTNLLMADSGLSDKEMWQALKKVNLEEFLLSKECSGLETKLTEQGANFSGGQRQRLSIARAFLQKSGFYIFDEATSSVDSENEDLIMKQIYELSKTKTVILITHRLANSVGAANIYVMKDGKVIQSGTHENLSGVEGEYSNLLKTQKALEEFNHE